MRNIRLVHGFLLASLCMSAPIVFSGDALATHEDAQGSVAVGAIVLAPGCTISLRNDGGVSESCHSAANITRRDSSSLADIVPAPMRHFAEHEADRTIVTVTY